MSRDLSEWRAEIARLGPLPPDVAALVQAVERLVQAAERFGQPQPDDDGWLARLRALRTAPAPDGTAGPRRGPR